jgi:phytoene dehydrogenase-like protein
LFDCVIIGAGICGLEFGSLLAHDGLRVLVLEKLHHYGGRAFLWREGGFCVDNGIHLIRFGYGSATARVFRQLGLDLRLTVLGESYVLDEDGLIKDFPTNPSDFLTSKLLSPEEGFLALQLMAKMRRGNPMDLLETSVSDWMNHQGVSGGVRKYLTLLAASMQVCPFMDRASMGEWILNLQAGAKKGQSVMYPARGWEEIYEALAGVIRRNGEIRTGTKADSVEVRDGRALGVRVGDETIEAGNVVINLPCQELFTVLDESLVAPAFAELCKNQRPTAGVVLDYGLKHSVCEDSGLWYVWDPMSFGMFTSNLCAEVAPLGKQLLTWFSPTRLEDIQNPDKARSRSQDVEETLFRLFPQLEDAIEWRRVQHLPMVDGAEINVDQHRHKRPGHSIPGIHGLYMVGDSLCSPGAGGDVGHESVLECYKEVTGREAGL